ncbi:uncharacterized protein TNCV_4644361 [Trichonephila clavipes]|nr:uncharacterized protein TNCV_4644361 [Trichonephila clavipes]
MPRGRHRASFHQVSEFDRGIIVAYSDCKLPCREICQRVGRNQATVMRIYHRWMQEETMNRRGRYYPPRCSNAHDNRRIVCMAVMDHAAVPRAISQQISLLHIMRCPLVPFEPSAASRVESPQGFHCFFHPCLENTGICAANGAMNGGH